MKLPCQERITKKEREGRGGARLFGEGLAIGGGAPGRLLLGVGSLDCTIATFNVHSESRGDGRLGVAREQTRREASEKNQWEKRSKNDSICAKKRTYIKNSKGKAGTRDGGGEGKRGGN